MNLDLSKLLTVAEAATQGQWRAGRPDTWSQDTTGRVFKNIYVDDPRGGIHKPTNEPLQLIIASAEAENEQVSIAEMQANAEFIAACSPAVIVALVKELQAHREGWINEEILRRNDGYIKIARGCRVTAEKEGDLEILQRLVDVSIRLKGYTVRKIVEKWARDKYGNDFLGDSVNHVRLSRLIQLIDGIFKQEAEYIFTAIFKLGKKGEMMGCLNCHNQLGKFCKCCGAQLYYSCRSCQCRVSVSDEFCGQCGAKQTKNREQHETNAASYPVS